MDNIDNIRIEIVKEKNNHGGASIKKQDNNLIFSAISPNKNQKTIVYMIPDA